MWSYDTLSEYWIDKPDQEWQEQLTKTFPVTYYMKKKTHTNRI